LFQERVSVPLEVDVQQDNGAIGLQHRGEETTRIACPVEGAYPGPTLYDQIVDAPIFDGDEANTSFVRIWSADGEQRAIRRKAGARRFTFWGPRTALLSYS
jgi:hypothetical protein